MFLISAKGKRKCTKHDHILFKGAIIFSNILIVCIGNICRSPTAEKIIQSKCPKLNISSAGINALVGQPIDPSASFELIQKGYDSENHSARQISDRLVQEADLILVMEKFQQQRLMSEYPAASGKVMLLGKWQDNLEINDPYRKSAEAFAQVFNQIENACDAWSERLN